MGVHVYSGNQKRIQLYYCAEFYFSCLIILKKKIDYKTIYLSPQVCNQQHKYVIKQHLGRIIF